ncbi:MAG: hypothetical protein AB8B74_14610 [Crocinitomicaceae bacterium]
MKLFSICIISFLFIQCSTKVELENDKAHKAISQTDDFKIIWHWEDEFSEVDQEKLKTWLNEVTDYTMLTLGQYQFDLHYYFHLSDGGEPVPFAHTTRKKDHQSVHFYVNPSFTLEEFIGDWTAQHEISHLSAPFVGRKNMWFSEGYATYLSRKIMIRQGYYSNSSFDSLYTHRIGGDNNLYNSSDLSVVELCSELKSAHNYSSIYYAGSAYFFLADMALKADSNMELIEVVQQYQTQNRLLDDNLSQVIASFDQISQSTIFSELYEKFTNGNSADVLKIFRQ